MARDPGTYSEDIVLEFYISYAATLWGSIDKSRFPYGPGPDHTWDLNTAEFDYRWDVVRSRAFTRTAKQREAVILWLAKYIIVDGERAKVSPTKVDNQVTWDRAIMVAALVAGLEIDFAPMLLAKIHDRAFRTSTTYPFPCLIFQLCKDFGVSICHYDRLIHPTRTLDIGLIQDEANVAAPHRGLRIDVPLGTDLVDVVEQMQGDKTTHPVHTNDAPASSFQATSQAFSSSRASPPLGATVILLVRVQKLEAQMTTLLHHIKPWMRKLIVDSEARVKKMMEAKSDHKVEAVHKQLDAFELRFVERPAPTTDMSSFCTNLASLRADVDAILATPVVEPQAAPSALGNDTVLGALFNGDDAEEQHKPASSRVLCDY
ncbi:hypothetical protein H5410_046229 [Solanum commersonii]|uniref:Putative plant transposon protein domain-containing protein n=1 Tax=Solanum commersonii TaxID=4109 RepID=A0A9J5XBP4_SOLCO|nr:hypothetical protein H5410_046229 [Solanum commersonii]